MNENREAEGGTQAEGRHEKTALARRDVLGGLFSSEAARRNCGWCR